MNEASYQIIVLSLIFVTTLEKDSFAKKILPLMNGRISYFYYQLLYQPTACSWVVPKRSVTFTTPDRTPLEGVTRHICHDFPVYD